MSTTYHTAISNGASNDASTVNTPLGELDAQIVTHNSTLISHSSTITSHTSTLTSHGSRLDTLEAAIGGVSGVDESADFTWTGDHEWQGDADFVSLTAQYAYIGGTKIILRENGDVDLSVGTLGIHTGDIEFTKSSGDPKISFSPGTLPELYIKYDVSEEELLFQHSDGTDILKVDRANKRVEVPETLIVNTALNVNTTGGDNFPLLTSYANVTRLYHFQNATRNQLNLDSVDLGNDERGGVYYAGANTSEGDEGGAPGQFASRHSDDGNWQYLWSDDSGVWRTSTSPATGNAGTPSLDANAGGTVVGAQTSFADSKVIEPGLPDVAEAIARVRQAGQALRHFSYRDGRFQGERFAGLVTDLAPQYGMDRDAEHPQGKALNEIQLHGDFIAVANFLLDRLGV